MMKNTILIPLIGLIWISCSSEPQRMSLFVKSLDPSNIGRLKLKVNDSLVINTDVALNTVDHSYQFFDVQSYVKKNNNRLEVILDDSIQIDTILQSLTPLKLVVIIQSRTSVLDYNNPEIYLHMPKSEVLDYKRFVDSLYNNKIIKEKTIKVAKDSVLSISIR